MEVINDNGVDKLHHEGKIAVLVSHGWGAGWSTWGNTEIRQQRLYDPEIAKLVYEMESALKVLGSGHADWSRVLNDYSDRIQELAELRYPDDYNGGTSGLAVLWLEPGTHFRVSEYDGAEMLEICEQVDWEVA
jgi:hypothetical protein